MKPSVWASVGSWAVAVVAALTFAALAASFAAWCGWRAAPPLPDSATVSALSAHLLPGATAIEVQRRDVVFGYEDQGGATADSLAVVLGGDDYEAGYVQVTTPAVGVVAQSLATAEQHLREEGWTTKRGAGLTATRGQYYLELYLSDGHGNGADSTDSTDSTDATAVTLILQRAEPTRAVIAGVVVWFAVLALALAVGRQRRPDAPAVAMNLLLAGSALLLPGTLVSTVSVVGDLLSWGPGAPDSVWAGYVLWLIKPVAGVGALVFGVGLLRLIGRKASAGEAAPA